MTERRATITRNWRPPAPVQRLDDFQEVEAVEAPVRAEQPTRTVRLVERRSIGRRLENWGAWANKTPSRGGRGEVMTAVVCDNMLRHSDQAKYLIPPAPVNDRIDVVDADRVNRAFTKLPENHRKVLQWTYVECLEPWGVAGACGFPTREYGIRLGDAQAAIEAVVGGVGSDRA